MRGSMLRPVSEFLLGEKESPFPRRGPPIDRLRLRRESDDQIWSA